MQGQVLLWDIQRNYINILGGNPMIEAIRCRKDSWESLVESGVLVVGENTIIDEDVWLCHWKKEAYTVKPHLVIGKNCVIRSGTVIYGDVTIGDNCNFGQHVVVREGCRIGNNTSIGTGVKVECYTHIGNFVSIETQSHITGWMTIEDGVFVGGFVGSTNDLQMKWKREGHGADLIGPTLKYGCRIGSGAILLPGTVVGKNSVVNVGEVVRKDIPDNTMMFTKKGKVVLKKIKVEEMGI